MLVLHPTSQCDVCLEPYTSDSSELSPHAIPCGHIFCRNCLGTFDPANCPLCRKPFLVERIKKLHVDKPEPDELRQNDYLHRLILAWDAEEAELLALLEPVRTWLEPEDDDVAPVLRRALSLLVKFKKLKAKRMDDHRIMKRLHNRIADDDRERATESEEFKAVEMSLLSQVEKLETSLSMHKDEIDRLNAAIRVRPASSEFIVLQNKVAQYEAELEQLRPRVKLHENEIRRLRKDLEYFTNISATSLQSNPLPQPPAPVSYDHLPALAQALASNGRHVQGSPYTNGHTSGVSPEPPHVPKKNKGKEREPGPSYNLSTSSSSSSDSTTTAHNYQKNSFPPPDANEVLRGASPRRRVVPAATSKPPLLDTPQKLDPKLVSGARPDQPVPLTPANPPHMPLGLGLLDPQRGSNVVDSARDLLDPYTITAAYITEYAAGYGVGYRLAEYTPGEAARVIAPQPVGAASAAAVAFVNGHVNDERRDRGRERDRDRDRGRDRERERKRGLDNMNALGMSLPDTSTAPTIQSNQTERDNNSQAYRTYDVASVTTEDSAYVLSSTTQGDANANENIRRVPRDMPSQASLTSSTHTTGALTDNATLSSISSGISGLTGDSLLLRERSLRQTRRQTDTTQDGLGLGLPSTLNGTATSDGARSSRPRPSRHTSLPIQPVPIRATNVSHATTIMAAATEIQPVLQELAAQTSDNHSVRTASTWGTIDTHRQSLLSWQSTGSSLNILGLRGFGQVTAIPDSTTDDQRLENWGPAIPEGMVMSHHTGNPDAANDQGRTAMHQNRENGMFPVVRESDEERTPMSRSTRTLASVSSAGATNGSGARPPLDVPSVPTSQGSSGHREHERERRRNRNRERSSDRSRRQSHPVSLTPAHTGDAARYAQMTIVSEHGTDQSRSNQQSLSSSYVGAPQLGQLWFESNPVAQPPPPSSNYVQPHNPHSSSHPTRPQTQSQAHHRRTHRRLSVSTVPVPVDPQDLGPQSTVPSTAPLHAAAWSEAGYYTDGPSSSHLHNNNVYSSTRNNNNDGDTANTRNQEQNLLTSPTLFNSDSTTNALGLDGLDDPRPLQISAPTPIVPSRAFLRSFSYDNFS